jgi:hypothetical protein
VVSPLGVDIVKKYLFKPVSNNAIGSSNSQDEVNGRTQSLVGQLKAGDHLLKSLPW